MSKLNQTIHLIKLILSDDNTNNYYKLLFTNNII